MKTRGIGFFCGILGSIDLESDIRAGLWRYWLDSVVLNFDYILRGDLFSTFLVNFAVLTAVFGFSI